LWPPVPAAPNSLLPQATTHLLVQVTGGSEK
jgi:hypothetical protein